MERVVITGMGAVTPLGNDVPTFWAGLKAGKCGIGPITHFDASEYKAKLAAEVKDFNPTAYMDKRESKRMDCYCHFAVAAAAQAVERRRAFRVKLRLWFTVHGKLSCLEFARYSILPHLRLSGKRQCQQQVLPKPKKPLVMRCMARGSACRKVFSTR